MTNFFHKTIKTLSSEGVKNNYVKKLTSIPCQNYGIIVSHRVNNWQKQI